MTIWNSDCGVISWELMDVRFGPKVGQIGPNWDKSGDFFSKSHSVHSLIEPKFTEHDLKKSPDLFHLGANLTHFGPKYVYPTTDFGGLDKEGSV